MGSCDVAMRLMSASAIVSNLRVFSIAVNQPYFIFTSDMYIILYVYSNPIRSMNRNSLEPSMGALPLLPLF